MADAKISDLSAAVTLTGVELVAGVQSGGNVKITIDQIKTYMQTLPTLALGGASLGANVFAATGTALISGGTVATSRPVLDLSQGWTGTGVFTALRLNVPTDTGPASTSSLLLDLQKGSSSVFSIRIDGLIQGNSNGMLLGSHFASSTAAGVNGVNLGSTNAYGITSGGPFAAADTILSRKAAASWQFGAADAAAPVAQTIGPQSVIAGTTNTNGANFTIRGSAGTGTGAGGSIIFTVAPAGSTGSTQNPQFTALTIDQTRQSTFAGQINGSSVSMAGNILAGAAAYVGTSNWLLSSAVNGRILMQNFAANNFDMLQFGGTTASFPALKRNTAGIEIRLADDSGFTALSTGNISASGFIIGSADIQAGANFVWLAKSRIGSAVDGNIAITNNALTSFGLLQLGGTTSAFPALKRNGTAIDIRLADDSALTNLNSGPHSIGGATIGSDALAVTGSIISSTRINVAANSGTTASGFGMYSRAAGILMLSSSGIETFQNSSTNTNVSGTLGIGSTNLGTTGSTALIGSPSNGVFSLGGADAAAPVAQTVGVQSVVAGTTNTNGVNFTIRGSAGTGTGTGGSLIFQTAPAGSTGSTQNVQVTALTIPASGQLLAADGTASLPAFSFASAPTTGMYVGSGQLAFAKGGALVAYFDNSGRFILNSISQFQVGGATIGLGVSNDVFLSKKATASLQFGDVDAAAPVAQTIGPQSVVTGTSNTAGAVFTINDSGSTGTAASGGFLFRTTPLGGSGSTPNTRVTALTIAGSGAATFASTLTSTGNLTITSGTAIFGSSGIITGAGAGFIALLGPGSTALTQLSFGPTPSASIAALRMSSTTIQAKLSDNSAFTNIQGKLTTDTNYTAGAAGAATGYLTLYDAAGTAYKVEARV